MSDDYLFDPRAPPDPQVQALERALAKFRVRETAKLPRVARIGRRTWLAAAAVVAAAATLLVVVNRHPRWAGVKVGATAVALDDVEGAVTVDGDRIVCDAGGHARLRVGDIGWLTLEEKTRVRVVAGCDRGDGAEGEGSYRVDLERGTVSARIFAAPRLFWLGTPSAIAVELGCVYRTTVDDEGHATLAVTRGRVSFESDGRRVYVPAGASCRAWPGFGPGTPAWDDSSAELLAAVVRHDEARVRGDAGAARRALEELLAATLTADCERPRDSLTLWHLLDPHGEPDPDLRADVFDRLRELCPPPNDVTRERCLAGDADALAALASWREKLEDDCW